MNPFEDDEIIDAGDSVDLQKCLDAGASGVAISNEAYHALPGISGSGMKYMEVSQSHFDNRHLFNSGSDALKLGTMLHCMVLEPDFVIDRFAVMPVVDLRTNAGKEEKEAFTLASADKEVVTADEYALYDKMAQNVLKMYSSFISAGKKERSFFAQYGDLVIKARPDVFLVNGYDCDLKSISTKGKSLNSRLVKQVIEDRGYHLAAALRRLVYEEIGLDPVPATFIFSDTSLGNMCIDFELGERTMSYAKDKVISLLDERMEYLVKIRSGNRRRIIETYIEGEY